MLTVKSVAEAMKNNGWKETKFVCPDGAVAIVCPCGYNVNCIERCEYFLIYWDLPWGGEDKIEKLVDVLNHHAKLKADQEDDKKKLHTYYAEHSERGWDDDSWSFYSDWHKDVYGFRPRYR